MVIRRKASRRLGTVLVLTAVMMVAMFALLALAVDLGYVTLVRTQLQSSADAAALAATWELYDSRALSANLPDSGQANAVQAARFFASKNPIGQDEPELADADISLGRLDITAGAGSTFNTADPTNFNAVRVTVRRTADQNGEVPSFFARVVGVGSNPGVAEATAMFLDDFSGFEIPSSGDENLNVLPFALDIDTWNALQAGNTDDNWTWNEETEQISSGPDGVLEVNLFPQDTGSPGNRGTVDIGAPNNSTADTARQIVDGISQADLDHIGGSLELGPDGTMQLNGDTGISAGMKDELASISGEPRIILLFDTVTGNGNNATYNIVGFAGIRIMDVKLTGKMSRKRVIIQPARVQIHGGIPAPDDGTPSSYFMYSPVWLVR